MFKPKAIYFEKEIVNYPLGIQLMEQYKEISKVEIENHNNIEEMRKKQNSEFVNMKSNLIIGVRKTHKFVENYKTSDYLVPYTSSGCTAMCMYCYLVCNYNKCAYLRLFVNREQMLEKIIKVAKQSEKQLTFEIGSNSDLILENTITGNLVWTIENFANTEKGRLTLPTKFEMVDSILPLNHNGKIIIRMSVNPSEIINKVEFGTSRLKGRIEAINKLVEAGYKIGILIAPVILVENWQQLYTELIQTLNSELLEKAKANDKTAIKTIVEHNIRLVLYEVTNRFKSVEYDRKDLVSVGNVGLMKAILTFDRSRNVEFATYAIRCIDNEILIFLRDVAKNQNVDSLERAIKQDKEGNELKIEDTISDETDIVDEYEKDITCKIIREIIKELPDRDRKIIMLYFGFYNKNYTQKEIAHIMLISQEYVSKLIRKNLKKIEEQLVKKDIIVINSMGESRKKNTSRKVKSIYTIFNNYTKKQVNLVLESLTEEEKLLVKLRYGKDLDNPVSVKLSMEQLYTFYNSLIPKMRRLLLKLDEGIHLLSVPSENSQKYYCSMQVSNENFDTPRLLKKISK